jgi:hypothetical protein
LSKITSNLVLVQSALGNPAESRKKGSLDILGGMVKINNQRLFPQIWGNIKIYGFSPFEEGMGSATKGICNA